MFHKPVIFKKNHCGGLNCKPPDQQESGGNFTITRKMPQLSQKRTLRPQLFIDNSWFIYLVDEPQKLFTLNQVSWRISIGRVYHRQSASVNQIVEPTDGSAFEYRVKFDRFAQFVILICSNHIITLCCYGYSVNVFTFFTGIFGWLIDFSDGFFA